MRSSILSRALFILAISLTVGLTDSLAEVLTAPTMTVTDRREVATSVSTISAEDIADVGSPSVSELLKRLPGVEVVQSGRFGGNTSIFIRGANAENTLVLIDGIEVNDPGSPNRAYNFAHLTSENIERIEVLRGPQSTLYGSDASAGVISIVTKQGSGQPSGEISVEAGSYQSFIATSRLQGSSKQLDYSLSADFQDIGGFSSAQESYGNSEDDSYRNSNFSSRLGFSISERAKLNLYLRYITSDTDIDNNGGYLADDPDREVENNQALGKIEFVFNSFDSILETKLSISGSDHELKDNNNPDSFSSEFLRSDFSGNQLKLQLLNSASVSPSLRLLLGVETEQESAKSSYLSDGDFGPYEEKIARQRVRTNSVFAQAQIRSLGLVDTTTGLRFDDNEEFGSEITYRIAPSIYLEDSLTRLFATIGSGFKSPALYQLYSSFGNSDLEPEKSLGIDAGIEQGFLEDKFRLGATFFWNEFEDLITSDPSTFTLANVNRAKTLGVESFVDFDFSEDFNLNLNATLTDTEDKSSGLELLRRAKFMFNSTISYAPTPESAVNVNLRYTGARDDLDFSQFPSERVELSGYTTVNLSGRYQISEDLELLGRIENLFDKSYEDVLGYSTPGLSAYGGIKLQL